METNRKIKGDRYVWGKVLKSAPWADWDDKLFVGPSPLIPHAQVQLEFDRTHEKHERRRPSHIGRRLTTVPRADNTLPEGCESSHRNFPFKPFSTHLLFAAILGKTLSRNAIAPLFMAGRYSMGFF